MKKPPLQLKEALVGEVHLKPGAGPEFAATVNVRTEQSFTRGDDDNNLWQLALRVHFRAGENETKPAQYEGYCEVTGTFVVAATDLPEDKHLKIVAVTCPSLLYGTARELIAFLTARGANGTFLLPTVSFADNTLTPTEPPQRAEPAKPAE